MATYGFAEGDNAISLPKIVGGLAESIKAAKAFDRVWGSDLPTSITLTKEERINMTLALVEADKTVKDDRYRNLLKKLYLS